MKRIVLVLLGAAILISVGCFWWYYQKREHSQDAVIREVAQNLHADPALIKAVMWRESWFNPNARGAAGEFGLMQVRLGTAQEYFHEKKTAHFDPVILFNPVTNATIGTWYLQKLMKRYTTADNPLPYALADYNAGRAHVLNWSKGSPSTNSELFIENIKYPTTAQYVRSVDARYLRYKSDLDSLKR